MSHPFTDRRLRDILVARNLVDETEIEALLKSHGETGLAAALVREGRLTEETSAQVLAEQVGLPYADLEGYLVPPKLFDLISATYAYRYGVVPYRLDGEVLEVAVTDPLDPTLIDRLERWSGKRVRLVVSAPQMIEAALKRAEGASEVLRDVSRDFRLVPIGDDEKGGAEKSVSETAATEESPVVKLVNTLLLAAIQRRASDIHIETYDQGIIVKYRIDGVLYPAMDRLDRRYHGPLVSRLKVMAELDIAERRVPQDGRFRLEISGREIDFRVSVLPSVFGEDVVVRVLDKIAIAQGMKELSVDGLGFTAEVQKRLRRSVREPYGMVLITGPTGSGKTTTLYAAISELDAAQEKIITIEDPIEYQLEGIVQIPVNEKKGLTFARGLRSILRHDPDRIMVGEIRDSDTAQIAVQSALTGHLVFTTVHANNAFDVIARFDHMGIDTYRFVSALNCVLAQRLVRVICPECKRTAVADDALLELSGLERAEYGSHVWYEGAGCDACGGTGYRGRAAIGEFLQLSPVVRQMVTERRPVDALQARAVSEGMVTLRQAALAKALAGETTLKEINRVTFVD